MTRRGDGDLDLGVEDALQTGRVGRRDVELMQRRAREQTRPRHVELAGVAIDAEHTGLVAAADAIGDLAEQAVIEITRHQSQDRPVRRAVAPQAHVVRARLENRPVVVHVRHLEPHDRDGAQPTWKQNRIRPFHDF